MASNLLLLYVAGNNPAVNGSYKVVGNTGAIAAHSIPFANDLVLFLIRPNARIDFGGETTALPDQAYLLVMPSACNGVGVGHHHDGGGVDRT